MKFLGDRDSLCSRRRLLLLRLKPGSRFYRNIGTGSRRVPHLQPRLLLYTPRMVLSSQRRILMRGQQLNGQIRLKKSRTLIRWQGLLMKRLDGETLVCRHFMSWRKGSRHRIPGRTLLLVIPLEEWEREILIFITGRNIDSLTAALAL